MIKHLMRYYVYVNMHVCMLFFYDTMSNEVPVTILQVSYRVFGGTRNWIIKSFICTFI